MLGHFIKTAGGGPFSISYNATANTGSLVSPQTFSNVSFGAANKNRRVYIVVHTANNNTGATVSSMTIGGVNATLTSIKDSEGSLNAGIIVLGVADGVSGTSGDVVVTLSSGPAVYTFTIHSYSAYNQAAAKNNVVFDSNFSTFISLVTSVNTAQANTVNGGYAITTWGGTTPRDASVTGATENTTGSNISNIGITTTTGASTNFAWSWTGVGPAGNMSAIAINK